MQRLNSLVLMCCEPALGKAVAKEQDEHIMLTMLEARITASPKQF